ncbi:hypothetical protein EG68_01582 [Paragonimus skrjabini miyazakii]|uniref:Uncharacterized protein n=1 Tax=Paragonimus skrjabini miyazakii TaxID=59628 RepID=A0A8S9Z7C9_9TREM|nr:hypothetical protein EG68_01582 [Paragonimus skrjabini miyazakii]
MSERPRIVNARPFDLSENDTRLLNTRNAGGYGQNQDFVGPPGSPYELNNWDWLRLDSLGPGWEHALRDVPVNRREALNLLIIMKKKLLRAASELTFYKERVTILQEQMIFQKKNEEKLIKDYEFITPIILDVLELSHRAYISTRDPFKLRAAVKAQTEELQRLRDKSSKVPGLERTVRQQEELITRLETFMDRQRNHNVNTKLDKRLPDWDPFDTGRLDQLPPSPTPLPDTSDAVAATALRNLSNENESLRQTVTELSRTVRNLAEQQQEDHARQKQQEEHYREELELLREHQNQLAEQQATHNKRMESAEKNTLKTSLADNEKYELYHMLDTAEMRIRNLEEELTLRDRRPQPPNNEIPIYNRRTPAYKEPFWRHPGQDRLGTIRFPPVIGLRDRPFRRLPPEVHRAHASDSGLDRHRSYQQSCFPVRAGSSTGFEEDWQRELDDF